MLVLYYNIQSRWTQLLLHRCGSSLSLVQTSGGHTLTHSNAGLHNFPSIYSASRLHTWYMHQENHDINLDTCTHTYITLYNNVNTQQWHLNQDGIEDYIKQCTMQKKYLQNDSFTVISKTGWPEIKKMNLKSRIRHLHHVRIILYMQLFGYW